MRKTHVEEVNGELSPVGGTPCFSRGRTPLPEQDTTTETAYDELTITPIPHLPVALREQEIEPKKEGGVEGCFFFKICFTSH